MKPIIALLLLSVGAACAVESCDPPVYVDTADSAIVETVAIEPARPKTPSCGNVACGVADCSCVDCRCEVLGACLPAPVVQVSERTPVLPNAVKDILDTSRPPQACRRNADGSWSCGPAAVGGPAVVSSRRFQSKRVGPVRKIVRRIFGG